MLFLCCSWIGDVCFCFPMRASRYVGSQPIAPLGVVEKMMNDDHQHRVYAAETLLTVVYRVLCSTEENIYWVLSRVSRNVNRNKQGIGPMHLHLDVPEWRSFSEFGRFFFNNSHTMKLV